MAIFDKTPFSQGCTMDNRLNARHSMIIGNNLEFFEGKRILDLGSYDGRWSWAALNAGAAHITGIEGRPALVKKAQENFHNLNIPSDSYTFICSDVFQALDTLLKEKEQNTPHSQRYDTILCLGIFYHIMDHYRLLRQMTELAPEQVIIDTGLVDSGKPFINLVFEDVNSKLNAIPEHKEQQKAIVGFASRSALRAMTTSLGWNLEYLNWQKSNFSNTDALSDYFNQGEGRHRRYTAILKPNLSNT